MFDHVDYGSLDSAKNAFIAASRKTLKFAEQYGLVMDEKLGASANVFALDLSAFLEAGAGKLYTTLLPEGLGTADDARPDDLNEKELTEFWHNIGIKTVAVMTNDAAASGLQSILISLYLPSSDPAVVFSKPFMEGFLNGFVEGCKTVGCVYLSGETPQLKNKIMPGKLDIAGAIFALSPAGREPVQSTRLAPGNSIVFIESSGPHENGFTTLRKLAENLPDGYHTKLPTGIEYWQALNAPSKLYTPLVQSILSEGIMPTNIEPISGHGWQKLMRARGMHRYVIKNMLPVLPVFEFVQEQLKLTPLEMIEVFNYGVGYAIFTENEDDAAKVVELATKHELQAIVAGYVEAADKKEVFVEPLGITLGGEKFALEK